MMRCCVDLSGQCRAVLISSKDLSFQLCAQVQEVNTLREALR